jgi:hypothetical protein
VILNLVSAPILPPKPILGAPQSLEPEAAAVVVAESAHRGGAVPALWASALTHPRFALVQRIRVADRLRPDHNVVRIFLLYPKRPTPGHLEVMVEGTLVERLTPRTSRRWGWTEVPVRRDLLEGKEWVSVTLRVVGPSDNYRNFAAVAGGSFEADGLESAFFNGYGYLTEDMSSARGAQAGTLLIFLNERWPERIVRMLPAGGLALDYSIVERMVWARVALANYADHPLVGSGFGSLVFRAPRYIGTGPVFVEFANAHSNFVQVLSECGPLGFAGWLLLVIAPPALIGARCWRRRASPYASPFHLAFGGFTVAWALTSLAQYTLTDTRLFHLWVFYLGIWAAQFHRGGYGLLPWPGTARLGAPSRSVAGRGVTMPGRAG